MTTIIRDITLHRRVNVTLPEDTLALLDRVAKKGDRSAFLDKAVHYYVKKVGTYNLKCELKKGAIARADRDLAIAKEWFPLVAKVWPEW